MKATGICPKCRGEHVMRVPSVADAGGWTGDGAGPIEGKKGDRYVARFVLQKGEDVPNLFGSGTTRHLQPAGETEGYACADCGYFEEYLKAPREISWDAIEGATKHRPGTGGPYR